jgi:hypothetical protein
MKATASRSERVEMERNVASLDVDPPEAVPPRDAAPKAAPAEPTLEVVLTTVARRSPDALVAAMCAVGVVGVAVVLIFFRSFCAWAIADREMSEHARHPRAWRALKATVGLVGMSALFVLCLSLLAVALGMWKS